MNTTKLGGYDFYRSIGSPKYIVAPMVDQSELAWRMLSRSPLPPDMAGPSSPPTKDVPYPVHPGGATLCYTPMIHAKMFGSGASGDRQFDLTHGEEGSHDPVAGIEGGDRPLFVQFCANEPEALLAAARKVEKHCDAVDINFGCPQGIAKRGRYGSFLQDDWETIKSLIGILHENLSIPVTAKFRIFPDKDRTIAYAKMMEAAGAQILTCHGRTREMKGQFTGLADWEMIKAVKQAVKIPVFANGNILYREDVDRCLEVTGCDGVMSAEGNLSNPSLFLSTNHRHVHPPVWVLAHRYLDIVEQLKTITGSTAIRAHLFRLLKPELEKNEEYRDRTGRASLGLRGEVDAFREIVRDIETSAKVDTNLTIPPLNASGYRTLPSYLAQPYIRPSRPDPTPDADTNVASPCASSEPPCSSIAASRCPTKACLVHCRQIRAVASGMDPNEAAEKSRLGQLVGHGCEAHELKFQARKEKTAEKRKLTEQAKERRKLRKSIKRFT